MSPQIRLHLSFAAEASGIGAMLSRGFAANGANTILVDINKEALTTTKQELEGVAASAGFASAKVLTSVNLYCILRSFPQGTDWTFF